MEVGPSDQAGYGALKSIGKGRGYGSKAIRKAIFFKRKNRKSDRHRVKSLVLKTAEERAQRRQWSRNFENSKRMWAERPDHLGAWLPSLI